MRRIIRDIFCRHKDQTGITFHSGYIMFCEDCKRLLSWSVTIDKRGSNEEVLRKDPPLG